MTDLPTWDEVASECASAIVIADEAVDRVVALVEDASSSTRVLVAKVFHDASSSPLTMCPSSAPDRVTADDLLAAALDGGCLTGAGVARVLGLGPHATEISEALGALPRDELYLVGLDGLAAMETLHLAVRLAVGRESSAVVDLLCARKRPDLFPWFGASVRAALGLSSASEKRAEWMVARQLVGSREVVRALDVLLTNVAVAQGSSGRDGPGRGSRLQDLSLVLGVLVGPHGPVRSRASAGFRL